ncbi:MAG TPA: ComEC/Rec2 family competence protein [Hyphomicrobiales bacterium]|nr:ComEC/Rec2 family competence protein [Hyphomicrobiales bacterium]
MSVSVPAGLPSVSGGVRGSAPGFSRLAAALAAQLDAEQGRWSLWIPVFFGCGIGAYFALPAEPDLGLACGLAMAALSLRILARSNLFAFFFASIALCMSLGFLAATLRTAIMAAPVLERHGAYEIEGFVESFDRQTSRRGRAVIRLTRMTFENAEIAKKPFRVRVSIRGDRILRPGSAVKLRAILGPPPEPSLPGGYDFARMSYFQGVGASGYSLSKPEVLEGRELPLDLNFRSRLADLRARIGERIIAVLPGQTGEVAAALTVGQTAGLDESAMDDLRRSGLAHVISISGLHMSLVAGTVFWFLRWVLAFFPSIALRFSVRAVAGGAALACVTVYLALSGAAVAAVRSYLMIAVLFLAILLNRPALSLRNVALAGLVILIVLPDSLIDVSFQMSFAATAALIAGYERFGRYLHFEAKSVKERLIWQPVYIVGGVLVTTATAGLAVEPFSAYHFHNLTSYGALGNLLGGPPIDFLVMPAMVVALVAMPFGLDEGPLKIMGFGIDTMMAIAKFVASLPGALIAVPAFPFYALLAMVAGGLWLIIWRRPWRLFGFGLIGAGIALTSIRDRPDILVDREAKIVAVRGKDGKLHAPKSRKAQYALGQWLKADGDGRKPKEAASGVGWQCDAYSCLSLVKGQLVSFVLKPDAVREDCQRASILVAAMDIRQPCTAPKIILDRGELWAKGSSAIFLSESGILSATAASERRGVRPWSPERKRYEAISPMPFREEAAEAPAFESVPE